MKRIAILSLLILSMSAFTLWGQENQPDSYQAKTLFKEVKNEAGQAYELVITLPATFTKERPYKVLYYIDAWWLSDLVKGSYRIHRLTKKMEEVILVGISLEGDEDDWNRQRNRDYTPSIYDIEKMKINMKGGNIDLNEETTGGAEQFIQFMKSVVFTEIESRYKTDPKARGILGHSFGGLFSYYCLSNHPELFKNYLLLSPSIWWNKSEFVQDEELQKIQGDPNLFVIMGSAESNLLKRPIRKMVEHLEAREEERMRLRFKTYEGLDHHSVLPIGIYEGLEFLYKKKKDGK
ncbi:MAG: alpha/beta hydrolase-fold protein [Bacteroidota bacterium]